MLTQLQRADVGNDGPAIARGNLRSIIRHGPEAIGHDIVEITVGRLPQPVQVIGGRTTETSLDHHSVAVAESAVADTAKNVVPLGAALEQILGHGQREGTGIFWQGQGVLVQAAARNRAIDQWPLRAPILEKSRGRKRSLLRLTGHVLATTARCQGPRQQESQPQLSRATGVASDFCGNVNFRPR